MGDIRIAGHMARKRIVKNLSGQIIDLMDETDGGWIIRGGQVVNQEKYQELLRKEEDRKKAAKAQTEAIVASAELEAQRNGKAGAVQTGPDRVSELEKRIDAQDSKLDAILEAINSKKE